jgi:hypothetical protein
MEQINNESAYAKASARADELFGAKEGTKEFIELQALLKAMKAYENDFVNFLKNYK